MIKINNKSLWIIWFILLSLYIYMAGFVMAKAERTVRDLADSPSCAEILDLKFNFKEEDIQQSFECMGKKAFAAYRIAEVQDDVIYMICYGIFFVFTSYRIVVYSFSKKTIALSVCLFPAFIALSDYCENIFLIRLIDAYPVIDKTDAAFAALFNTTKWSLLIVYIAILLILLIVAGIKKTRTRSLKFAN